LTMAGKKGSRSKGGQGKNHLQGRSPKVGQSAMEGRVQNLALFATLSEHPEQEGKHVSAKGKAPLERAFLEL